MQIKRGKIILDPLYNEVNRIIEYEGEDVYLITAKNGRYGGNQKWKKKC